MRFNDISYIREENKAYYSLECTDFKVYSIFDVSNDNINNCIIGLLRTFILSVIFFFMNYYFF